MKLLNIMILLLAIVSGVATGYGLPQEPERVVEVVETPESIIYTPFPEVYLYDVEELELLPIDQTIKSSLDAAWSHKYYYEQGIQPEHNLYWEKVHLSATYYLRQKGSRY